MDKVAKGTAEDSLNAERAGASALPARQEISHEEMITILGEWNCSRQDAPLAQPGLLHELFENQADARPSHMALELGDQRMSYSQLEIRANQLAHYLRAQGVGCGSLVAIWLPRSIEVYVALLGILKAGAAYVPLDPEWPADRVVDILQDCQVHTMLTISRLAGKCGAFTGRLVALDRQSNELFGGPDQRLASVDTGVAATDLCYVIYTSGSTGRPKGVQIEHRSACHLVRAESQIFAVQPDDRVYQGFSLAFDASVEEIWLAFFAGATLVIGLQEVVRSGPALARFLTESRVSVYSCVPTTLSLIEEDLPSVRLLILGGEVCSADLVKRWWSLRRRMVNTYGPTEATVIATYTDCHPQKAVTIGRPIPNYSVYILDANLQPVPTGVAGELHIGGIGVARGYLGREDLTQEKFVKNPFGKNIHGTDRLYKTGDLARFTPEGEIEFLGRLDAQVKLRGFRIELAEIESVLMQCPGILAAAACVREDVPGLQQLVGYVVARDQAAIDEAAVRTQLRAHLPPYMVPSLLEVVSTLPVLANGKIDRKKLPPPRARSGQIHDQRERGLNAGESKLLDLWETFFSVPMTRHSNFFLDLGGHSLIAARVVSELRKDPAFAGISVLDVYQNPTVALLAAKFDGTKATCEPTSSQRMDHTTGANNPSQYYQASSRAHFLCGICQAIGLYFIIGFFALQWLAPYLTYTGLVDNGYTVITSLLAALGILTGLYPVMVLAAIIVKWLVIGRYKPGCYRLWGLYYFRWWFANAIQGAVPIEYMCGSPFFNWYCRLMGAKIGRNVHLDTDSICIFDLLSIGDDSCIGCDVNLAGFTVENGYLIIGPIRIGRGCFIGTRSVLRENTTLGDGAKLEDLSLLPKGATIPAGQTWIGSPAQLAESKSPKARPSPKVASPSWQKRVFYGLLHAMGLVLFPTFVLAALFPGIILLNYLYRLHWFGWMLIAAPVVAVSFVVMLGLEIAAVKWLLLGKVKPGCYPLHSWFYLRKWFVDQLLELSLDILGPLYSTIYLAPWYRCLGAKLGRRAEISTASFISPDLLEVGDESFIADCVSLGAARIENGRMTIARTKVGKRSFIGNSAILPPGVEIGDNCLIGCLSAPPTQEGEAAKSDLSWLGSPSFHLPQRQASKAFNDEQTFKPTRKLWLQRGLIEFLRVTLPSTCFILFTSVMITVVLYIDALISLPFLIALFPVIYTVLGAGSVMMMVLMKWVLMGKYQPTDAPLWSTFVWRTELITAMHEYFANLLLVGMLEGTPFVVWFYRLLGSKIGKRVWMNTTELTEFDLVEIGDDTTLNDASTLQTHLFEDRVMKTSTIKVGPKCSVGGLSLVLYDTAMEQGSSLNDLSLLMKGEVLPAWTAWEGIPARASQCAACQVAREPEVGVRGETSGGGT